MRCRRCGGAGYIEKFSHVEGGKCYDCYGRGYTLKENDILVTFLDENKNVIDRGYYKRNTKTKIVIDRAKELKATSIKTTKLKKR